MMGSRIKIRINPLLGWMVFLVAGIFIGNRVFNHASAWLGLVMIGAASAVGAYKVAEAVGNIINNKKKKNNEKDV